MDELDAESEDWLTMGIKPPFLHKSGVFITYRDELFSRHVSYSFPSSFPSWLQAVANAGPRRLNELTALFLIAIGCSRVFIVDGAGDGGADVVGHLDRPGVAPLCLFAQSKSGNTFDATALEAELRKISILVSSGATRHARQSVYVDALLGRNHTPATGIAVIPIVIATSEFSKASRLKAREYLTLLRGPRQLAFELSKAWPTIADPQSLIARLGKVDGIGKDAALVMASIPPAWP
jgi:hypothetical protein